MDLAAYMYLFVIMVFSLVFGMIDVNAGASTRQNLFESVRDANQSALYTIQDEYEERKVITTPQMMEAWLMSYITDEDLRYENITLNFVQMETEPPLYLVYIEGRRDEYIIVSSDAYDKYISGATIFE